MRSIVRSGGSDPTRAVKFRVMTSQKNCHVRLRRNDFLRLTRRSIRPFVSSSAWFDHCPVGKITVLILNHPHSPLFCCVGWTWTWTRSVHHGDYAWQRDSGYRWICYRTWHASSGTIGSNPGSTYTGEAPDGAHGDSRLFSV